MGSENAGKITCYWNPSIRAQNCVMDNLKINVGKIQVSNGDEEIESVKGRRESDEMPSYSAGFNFFRTI